MMAPVGKKISLAFFGPTNHAQNDADVAGAERQLRRADAGVVGDERDVADRRQLGAAGQADAVDLGDHGQRQVPDLAASRAGSPPAAARSAGTPAAGLSPDVTS